MLFNSLAFLLFFPLTTAIYFALPHRARWAWLLACSTFFYASFIPKYLLVLLAVIVIDYTAGIGIESAAGRRRKMLLALSIVSNVGILAAFKYFDFFNANLGVIAAALHWNYSLHTLGWALPVGLSFHTFQSMAYTIEVYRGRFKAERHFGVFALYVLFYPQLVAGPIERPAHLLPQFRVPQRAEADRIFSALRLMLWGLFKKIVIADRMAILVDLVFKQPTDFGGGWVVVAAWLFAIQIYCDFSGYTDIAIGAARVLGIDLCTNFIRPYESASVAEFWRRWHISLSTWFRDYVYLPLGGNRISMARWCRNIAVVFVLSGLWHGANWTFVIWGALHGMYLIASRVTIGARERLARVTGLARLPMLRRALGIVIPFLLVSFAWLFFRAESLHHARVLLSRMRHAPWFDAPNAAEIGRLVSVSRDGYVFIAGVLIVLLLSVEFAASRAGAAARWARVPVWLRWPAYDALILLMLWIGDLGARSFIYFQF
jgi:D-alanyl-lipoteichoic acid acyltransferase DltB (MBOAT superfamily)